MPFVFTSAILLRLNSTLKVSAGFCPVDDNKLGNPAFFGFYFNRVNGEYYGF